MTDFLILVNKDNLLDRGYVPDDLIEIHEPMGKKIDLSYVNRLNKEAYFNFKEMQKDALKENYQIFIDSSYRTYQYQEKVFDSLKEEKGEDYAKVFVAPPGGSEHQTGLAIDIIFKRNNEMIEEQLETDPEIIWLFNNSYKYGFILRYPKGKENITGFNFEPWHFRYVGKDIAKEIYDRDITFEEYHSLVLRR